MSRIGGGWTEALLAAAFLLLALAGAAALFGREFGSSRVPATAAVTSGR